MADTRRKAQGQRKDGPAAQAPPEPATTRRSQRLIDRAARSRAESKEEPATRHRAAAGAPAASAGTPAALLGRALHRAAVGRRSPTTTESAQAKRQRREPELSGLWDKLPCELVGLILEFCDPRQMSRLETTCCYFKKTLKLDAMCLERLRAVPRAKGMEPNRLPVPMDHPPSAGENWASTLFFINSQSNAAAQATALALGNTHSAALLVPHSGSDGNHDLYTFGRGFHGQLAHDDFLDCLEPKRLSLGYQPCGPEHPGMEEEVTCAVATVGHSHTTVISRRGMLYAAGLNSRGQLGLEPNTPELPWLERVFLMDKPHLRIVSMACGPQHTLAISEAGTLWACGYNGQGQLGISSRMDTYALHPVHGPIRGYRVVAAAAGISHSMALTSDGSLFTWGSGAQGQLGHAQLMTLHLMHAAENSFVVTVPRKVEVLEPTSLQPWKRVTAISSGRHHCMVVTVCGELLGFGRNKHGELGLGYAGTCWTPTIAPVGWGCKSSSFFRTSHVACGANHTLALIMHNGKLVPCATGANAFGQLGQGHQRQLLRFAPMNCLASKDITTLQAGDHNSGAIGADGTVYLWGRNDLGQLGLGHTRSPWVPEVLPAFRAVHPDRTLRKSKRTAPRMRCAVADDADASTTGDAGVPAPPAAAKAPFFPPPPVKPGTASGEQPAPTSGGQPVPTGGTQPGGAPASKATEAAETAAAAAAARAQAAAPEAWLPGGAAPAGPGEA